MNLRLLSMVGLVALTSASFAIVGCSDDDGVTPAEGGAGGATGGKGGAGGKGGTANAGNAGKGGTVATAGSGVAGEEEEGGKGGTSAEGGSAPVAGSGGSTAGSGGKGGSGGTAGAAAGSGGTSGTAGSAGKGGSGGTAGATAAGAGGTGGATAGSGGTAGAAAGSGGTAGAAAGSGGSGGAAAGAGGAAAGSGGSGGAAAGSGGAAAGSGGTGGIQTTATGCAKLTVPYNAIDQVGTYGSLSLGGIYDLTAATISSKVYVQQQGSAAALQYLLEWTNAGNVTCTAYVGYTSIPTILAAGFGTYTLAINTASIPANTNGYCNGTATLLDRTKIKSIGVQLTASATATPATATVWLDSITVTGANAAIAPITFESTAPFTVYTYNGPTPAATVGWQATCP